MVNAIGYCDGSLDLVRKHSEEHHKAFLALEFIFLSLESSEVCMRMMAAVWAGSKHSAAIVTKHHLLWLHAYSNVNNVSPQSLW